MKLSVLADNSTIIDRYFLGEPAFSCFIETEDVKVLFDVGYSDVFIRNAERMNIDVLSPDFLVLSHGHLDHTGGLDVLLKKYQESVFEQIPRRFPSLIAHPDALKPKYINGSSGKQCSIGISVSDDVLAAHFDIKKSKEPVRARRKPLLSGRDKKGIRVRKH